MEVAILHGNSSILNLLGSYFSLLPAVSTVNKEQFEYSGEVVTPPRDRTDRFCCLCSSDQICFDM